MMLLFDMMTIGNRLLAARKRLGMTQAEVAERAGLSDRTYADIERGGVNMRIETFLRICRLPGRHPDGGPFLGGPAAGGAFAAAGPLQPGPAGDGSAAFGGVSAFPVRNRAALAPGGGAWYTKGRNVIFAGKEGPV